MSYMMKQCSLKLGTKHQVLWIPKKYAVKGNVLCICGEDGWEVINFGCSTKSYDEVSDRGQDYKRTRKYSDI